MKRARKKEKRGGKRLIKRAKESRNRNEEVGGQYDRPVPVSARILWPDGISRMDRGTSENNRRARYYRLTAAGRKQLTTEASKWERLREAIARILNPNREEV